MIVTQFPIILWYFKGISLIIKHLKMNLKNYLHIYRPNNYTFILPSSMGEYIRTNVHTKIWLILEIKEYHTPLRSSD